MTRKGVILTKKIVISLLLFLLILAALFCFIHRRPFQDLEAADIAAASVRLTPPDVTIQLEREEIETLAELLREVRLTHRDDSYTEYNGQVVVFTLTMADGTVTDVMAYNPFLVINGAGWRAAYEPCEALSNFSNRKLRA